MAPGQASTILPSKPSRVTFRYPDDLAEYVLAHWTGEPLPGLELLTELLSSCYQASLLTEELEPVRFRALLLEPERLAALAGPPRGYHRLCFAESRPLDVNTIRKLSPALEISQAFLGLRSDDEGLHIWGLVHSGARGSNSFYQSGRRFQPLPSCLLVTAYSPGALTVSNGSQVVAKLIRGRVFPPGQQVLSSNWMHEFFIHGASEMKAYFRLRRGERPQPDVDPSIGQHLVQSVFKRCLQLLRTRGHGATLLLVPHELGERLEKPNPYLLVRYPFLDDEPRRRCRTLLMRLLERLSDLFPESASWQDYLGSDDPFISELDMAFEEIAQLMASLGSADGAVLLTERIELLGFGVEIAGDLPAVPTIYLAQDVEGERLLEEATEGVGTRHRSVYRLCAKLPEILAIVLSQDGRIQVVKQRDGRVVCWDQMTTGATDF